MTITIASETGRLFEAWGRAARRPVDPDPPPSEYDDRMLPERLEDQEALGWPEWEPKEEAHGEGPPREPPAAELEPIRVYLNEIARVPLLTRDQEVALGRRIETAQRNLLGALAAVPYAVRRLAGWADRIRRHEAAFEELIVFPEGREVDVADALSSLRAFGRIGRLSRRLDVVRQKGHDRRLAASTRRKYAREMVRAESDLHTLLLGQHIRPAVLDTLMNELRQLSAELDRGNGLSRTRLQTLERRIGLPRRQFRVLFARALQHDDWRNCRGASVRSSASDTASAPIASTRSRRSVAASP
jgi:RNA polymerase primary sigma factor